MGDTHVWGDTQERTCCLCGETFRGQGANAEPVKTGRCCDPCDKAKVIPARIVEYALRNHPNLLGLATAKDPRTQLIADVVALKIAEDS